jgi:cell wall-associated NlpC family hydrolase
MSPRLSPSSATRLVLVAICVANLAACTSAPRFTKSRPPVEPSVPAATTSPPVDATTPATRSDDSLATPGARGNDVVERAQQYLGAPYRSGGTSTNGVDCSGLTYSVYRSVGVKLPRSSDEQARVGEAVPRSQLAPGDLIFFGKSGNVSHVGIYAGDGEFIHASTSARSVRFDKLETTYFRDRYLTARRVL